MSETLPEVDSFDANIVAPSGDDWMDDAAEVVTRIAQKLVNRTYNLALHRARLDAANTFAEANTFTKATTVQGATLNVKAVDANTAAIKGAVPDASSDFTHYLELVSGSAGLGVNIYTGSSGATLGGYVIAYNATFTKGVGWTQTVAGQASIALIFRYGDVRLVGKPAGAGTWAAWPQTTLSAFGATMLSQLFRAASMEVTVNSNSDQSLGYRYTGGPVARTSPLPLGSMWGATRVMSDGSVARNLTYPGEPVVWIAVRVPMFCSFGAIRARLVSEHDAPAGNDVFELFKRVGAGPWGGFGAIGVAPPGTLEPDERIVTIYSGATQVVRDNEEWSLRWSPPLGASANNNRIIGLEIDWTDIGPNNRVG